MCEAPGSLARSRHYLLSPADGGAPARGPPAHVKDLHLEAPQGERLGGHRPGQASAHDSNARRHGDDKSEDQIAIGSLRFLWLKPTLGLRIESPRLFQITIGKLGVTARARATEASVSFPDRSPLPSRSHLPALWRSCMAEGCSGGGRHSTAAASSLVHL